MEIVVEGTGVKEVLPDLVKIRIEFKFLEKTYDKSLEIGTSSVTEFINNVLPKLDLKKEDLKTTKYSIEHVIENDYRTDKEKDLGYQFEQISNIEFDYDKDKINTFMSETLKMAQIPEYNISFDIKDKETLNAEALKIAFNESEKKAKLIATASNLNLKKCQKTDFKPIENIRYMDFSSSIIEGNSDLDCPSFLRKKEEKTFTGFTDSFTPEKIKIMQTIYTLWIAE